MNSRIDFKYGGKKRIKKANIGAEWKAMNNTQKMNTIGEIGSTISNIVNLGVSLSKQPNYSLKYKDGFKEYSPKILKAPNDMVQQTNLAMQQIANPQLHTNQVQNPILNQAKLGTKRIKQKNLNRFK